MTVDIFEIKSGTSVAVRASTILEEKRFRKAKKPREEIFRLDLVSRTIPLPGIVTDSMTSKYIAARFDSSPQSSDNSLRKDISRQSSKNEHRLDSIRAGDIPMNLASMPSDANSKLLKVRINPEKVLKHKSSKTQLRSDTDSETSATGAPRTLRARASVASLRKSGASSLTARSPNVISARQDTIQPVGPESKTADRLDTITAQATKQKAIAASPVLTAMLRTQMKQKRIADHSTTSFRQSKTLDPVIISGTGMKVKAAISRNHLTQPSELTTHSSLHANKKTPSYSPLVKKPLRPSDTTAATR